MALQQEADERWQAIRAIWHNKEQQWLYAALGFMLGVLVSPFLLRSDDYLGNLFPEVFGIVFTVLVIERLNEKRAERQFKKETVSRLCRELGAQDRSTAQLAMNELQQRLYHQDGSLRGRWLTGIKLEKVVFHEADLVGAMFPGAKLINAHFWGSDLRRALFDGAELSYADMRDSDLREARLAGAILMQTRLQNANLTQAYLINAYVFFVEVDDSTILPDGTTFTAEQAMDARYVEETFKRFTDPTRDDFFYPDRVDKRYRNEKPNRENSNQ